MQILNQTYQEYLKSELNRRKGMNHRYSLRAFAKDLGIGPARLSEVLNRKQGLSRKAAEGISSKLGLGGDEQEIFCDLVASADSRSKAERQNAQVSIEQWKKKYNPRKILDHEVFRVICDWHHSAILELTKLDDFVFDLEWIAHVLKIDVSEVETAIVRLKNVGLLEEQGGTLVMCHPDLTTENDIPSEGIRGHHAQILKKAMNSLEVQPVEEREFGSLIVALNPRLLPVIKDKMRKFRDEMEEMIVRDIGKKSTLYCFGSQFFKLSHLAKRSSPLPLQ